MIDICTIIKQFRPTSRCLLCNGIAGRATLCQACHDELPWQRLPTCPICAIPTPHGDVCGECLRHRPIFDATLAPLAYAFPVDAMLRRFKYAGDLAIARTLAELMVPGIRALEALPEMLIPMPLHPDRLQSRGFNQATEISRFLARRLDLPLVSHACRRSRDTAPQAGLNPDERKRNLRGAFSCDTNLEGRHVALLDDVMTTGASMNELAHAVSRAGATRIDCWVVARTLKDQAG